MLQTINLPKWIEENRHLLKPPVGNKQVYIDNSDFIVMIVGGPNARRDFHINTTEELFYQLEGTITLKVIENDTVKDLNLSPGDMFLLPGGVPHSPRRTAGSIGLVIERPRNPADLDGFRWYCENCGQFLYEARIGVSDIVGQLPQVMNAFYADPTLTTCTHCGHVNTKPE